ncbi:MAG: acetate/propionate family kinase [Candidatus Latescibacterota bacterium]
MKIMVCNIGSTSFKFQLLDMIDEHVMARGGIERVGSDRARMRFYRGAEELLINEERPIPDQGAAVQAGLAFLTSEIIHTFDDIDAIGFKTVQAGEENGSVLLTDKVLRAMEDYSDLAPAHNPAYLKAIRMFRELMPCKDLVGVFEPGFHTKKPEYACVYGTPLEWYEKYGVRKYGYHGASLRYVTGETVRRLGLDPKSHKVVACHLGGSSSVCAYKDGVSIDTSMGLSAQSGLIQSTRVGDIDAFAIPYIMKKKGITMEEAYRELSSNGGLRGLSGTSGDMRDILEAVEKGSRGAKLAREKYIYDIKFYMGAYIFLMEGVDAVTFTGGMGQKDPELREEVLRHLEFLGFRLDAAANARDAGRIDAPDSKIAALVIETNEELIVARETVTVVS